MRRLDARKDIVLTKHLGFRWARRVSNQMSLEDAEDRELIIRRLKQALESEEYALIDDESEAGCRKYRLVCNMWGECLTFVVLDSDWLIFKTMWPSKSWEAKKLEK